MSADEAAETIRARMRNDMVNTLREHLGANFQVTGALLDDLVADGMFPVYHLIVAAQKEDRR